MSETAPVLTAEQWSRICQIVHDEALRARVAASFLPLFGPLPGDVETVPRNELTLKDPDEAYRVARLAVDDHKTIRIARVSVNVFVKNRMLADPDLAAAGTMFRRAAEVVARVEDAIVFNGRKAGAVGGLKGLAERQVYDLGGSDDYEGLVDFGAARRVKVAPSTEDWDLGRNVFNAIIGAILKLEENGHFKPYACVLGHNLFRAVTAPVPNSMVLPRDGIMPFLEGGPLLRASSLRRSQGLVVSMLGEPAEIVVPSDISVRYLQATLDGEHVFRVSQRFALRVKEPSAIALLELGAPDPDQGKGEMAGPAAQQAHQS